jgi:NADH-quinone oxidoreductase subunit G
VQVKQNKVMRVLPRENEDVNECWLSDKDRFSYEGLNSEDRLTRPMIKRDGQWSECDWQEALEFTATKLLAIKNEYGAKSIGAIGSSYSTCEELYLLQKMSWVIISITKTSIDFQAIYAPWLEIEHNCHI